MVLNDYTAQQDTSNKLFRFVDKDVIIMVQDRLYGL